MEIFVAVMRYCVWLMFVSWRFIQYNPTSLERLYKHELLAEVDLGVPIDLILPETYAKYDHSGKTWWIAHTRSQVFLFKFLIGIIYFL